MEHNNYESCRIDISEKANHVISQKWKTTILNGNQRRTHNVDPKANLIPCNIKTT
jgi:hypothetical protein